MGLEEAKKELISLVETHLSTNAKDFAEFIHFAQQSLHKRFEQVMVDSEPDALKKQMKLEEIIEELKTRLPQELKFGEAPDELEKGYAHYPVMAMEESHHHHHGDDCQDDQCGHDHGNGDDEEDEEMEPEKYTKENSFHLDSFLYSDEEVDRMAQQGMVPRTYCLDCGSRNTEFLNYVSNSLSSEQLEIVFGYRGLAKVFPSLKGKKIVDVGSRIGAVLFYAHIFTEASEIVGVEVNKFFTDLCQKVVNGNKMQDRVKVIHSDVFKQIELVKSADIVVMHNVFEWFSKFEQQKNIWNRVKKELLIKPGQIIVTTPALDDSLTAAGIDLEAFGFEQWVEEIPLGKSVEAQEDKDDCCATGDCGGCCDDCCEGDEVCAEDCIIDHEHHRHDNPNHHHHDHSHGEQPDETGIHLYRVL